MDAYSGNSLNAVRSMKEQYGIRSKKIWLLYNGVDFNLLKPERNRTEVLEDLDLDDGHFLIGTAARLVDWKRIDLLIRAFSKVEFKSKKLIIFGDGVESRSLKILVCSLGIENQVVFAGEMRHMPDCYQILDCFVLPSSDRESFGNAVVEAMYMKIPTIIMEDSGGLREHVKAGETGWIAAGEEDLVQTIEYIHDNPGQSERIVAQGSRYVQEKYSTQKMVETYSEFYREIASGA